MSNSLIDYVHDLQADADWRSLLESLSAELEAQLDAAALQLLFTRVGQRFAKAHSLNEVSTLADLERELNLIWRRYRWGYVTLDEQQGYLRLAHQYFPLIAVTGSAGATWPLAFLEGAYQEWFVVLGVDSSLKVRLQGLVDELGSVELRFGRPSVDAQPQAVRTPDIFS